MYNCPHNRETIKLEKLGDVTVSELSIGDIESFRKNNGELNDNEIIRIVKKYSSISEDNFNELVLSEVGYLYDRILAVTFGDDIDKDDKEAVDEKK